MDAFFFFIYFQSSFPQICVPHILQLVLRRQVYFCKDRYFWSTLEAVKVFCFSFFQKLTRKSAVLTQISIATNCFFLIQKNRMTLGVPTKDEYKPRVVLVTGGAGFIGSHVAVKLVKRFPDCKVSSLTLLFCTLFITPHPHPYFCYFSCRWLCLINWIIVPH